MDQDVKKAEKAAAAANAIKTECEDALAEAIPILEVGWIKGWEGRRGQMGVEVVDVHMGACTAR